MEEKKKCNFYFATKLVVDKLSDDKYVVLLRREPFRELLLIPRPNDDESVNYRHYNNEALVQEEGFWKDLLSKRESLKFNSMDHLGPNYLLQDCDELKEKRLRPAEHLLMLKAVSNLTSKIEDNNKKLIEKIEDNNKNLIETMNKNTVLLIEAIKGIGKS